MKRTAEFWMRISITLFFILLALSAPIIFFPFGISLILSILLTPLAQKLYKWINMTGIKNIPYDIPIIISFGIFIGIIYLIAIHIFCTIHHGVKSVYKKYSCYILCIAVSNSRVGSSLSFEFASCGGARFHCKNDSRDRGIYIETCTIQFVSNIFFCQYSN